MTNPTNTDDTPPTPSRARTRTTKELLEREPMTREWLEQQYREDREQAP